MADFKTAARPYAKAVFEMARETGNYDVWSDRLQFPSSAVQSPELSAMLDTPNITHQQRSEILEKVAGDKLDDQGRNFVRLLSENNRVDLLPDVAGIYDGLKMEAEGEVEAQVVSAFELTPEQSEKIAGALSKRLNRKVLIASSVDSDLIGGAIIRAGDLVIDGSVKGRLAKMSSQVQS